MQWIKDKVAQGGKQSENQNFMVGSDKWIGTDSSQQQPVAMSAMPTAPAGSFRNPESAQYAVQNFNSLTSNPYVLPPGNEDRTARMYPDVYGSSDQQQHEQAGAEGYEEQEVLTGAQELVTIPGAVVHLIDEEESVHLATGDFSIVRFVQEKTKVMVIAKVGDDLKWPIVQQEPSVKLDPTHYFFTLQVPKDLGDEDDDHAAASLRSGSGSGSAMDTLNYGVTFPAGATVEQADKIRDLDYFLARYSTFTAPTVVKGGEAAVEKDGGGIGGSERIHGEVLPAETIAAASVSGKGTAVVAEEEEGKAAAFWTTIAPNVDDYNSKLAKSIATGAGRVVKNIFSISDSAIARLDSSHDYMVSKFKPKNEKTKISPVVTGGVRSVRKLSAMTDKVVGGVLGGILFTTGLLASAVVKSPPGKLFFRTTPGEVALVSLDAFGTMFDAIEKAGRDVLGRSSSVTQDFVNYRYGESAKELTDESFKSVGHGISTVWTVAKIQKAFNPKALVSKTGMAKTIGKNAVKAKKAQGNSKADGSQNFEKVEAVPER